MTGPIVLDDDIRQAVHDEDCDRDGHQLDLRNAAGFEAGTTRRRIAGPADGKMPHLYCTRCGHVWIVLPFEGRRYAQAERRFRERLLPTDPDALPVEP